MDGIRKVPTAVIGCGMISNVYLKNLEELFYIIDLVAVCDIFPAAAEAKAKEYGIDRIMTLEEIEASDEIELVVNLTGPAVHYDIIRRMLLAGKHVYTEKMMTTDLEKGKELLEIAEEKQLYLGVAPDMILGAGIQTAKWVIDSGLIGTVTSVRADLNRNQAFNSETYRFIRSEGGSLPYDVGIYYIAAMLTLLGPVRKVMAFGEEAGTHRAELLFSSGPEESWKIPGVNLMCGILEFVSGVKGTVHFDGTASPDEQHGMTLYGTKGILRIDNPASFHPQVLVKLPESEEIAFPYTHGYNGVNMLSEYAFQGFGHRGVGVAEMAWAIRQGRTARCSKEYGFHCMEVLCGMEESVRTGRPAQPQSRFEMEPLKSGFYSAHNGRRGDAERSLME